MQYIFYVFILLYSLLESEKKMKSKNNKIKRKTKITDDDRMNIQAAIKQNYTLNKIACIINKDRSSVYREIVCNAIYKETEKICANCKFINECKFKLNFNQYSSCQRFQYLECELWKKFPYTCNNCKKSNNCWKLKRHYDWKQANIQAETNKSLPRKHYKVEGDDLLKLDGILSKLIAKKQSIDDIWNGNAWVKNLCCPDTIRNYIYDDRMTIKKFQLPCYTSYKHHYESKYDYPRENSYDSERLLQRTFAFFLKYVRLHKKFIIWEYDSVEGKRKDEIDILTITLKKYRFQFGYIIRKHNPLDVLNFIRYLQKIFGDKYKEIFQINLSDNGMEFRYFHKIESDEKTGEILCRVFFTNTYKATDKAVCERNHRYVRMYIPKGRSLNGLTQQQVDYMFSNINSKPRKVLKNKTPYELVLKDLGRDFLDKINIKFVSPQDLDFNELNIKKV